MTAFDRLEVLDARVTGALDEIAAPARPDYLDDVFTVTARTRQRPRRTFLERWIPMDTARPRTALVPRVPLRTLVIVAILVLAAAATVAILVGNRPRVPPPFGPADNGSIAYVHGGDLWVRDSLTGNAGVLVAADGDQNSPSYSPDGRSISYATTINGGDDFMVAKADGSSARIVATIPPSGNAQAAWRPDSAAIALVYDVKAVPQLSVVTADGSSTRVIDLGELMPLDVAWRPPNGAELLVRARTATDDVGLYAVNEDGSGLRTLLPPRASGYGPGYTLSGASWSPDGRTIAYNAVTPPDSTSEAAFRVALMGPDGSAGVALPAPASDAVQESWPQFSPDGRSILVHRWTWADAGNEGWLAVVPADGSAPARDIGPRIPGGEHTGLSKGWSPDGTRVLMRTQNSTQVFSIDPVTGDADLLDWTTDLPDWQRTLR
jgi:Tol biopolymer transport system component